jgi:hypothetical protein
MKNLPKIIFDKMPMIAGQIVLQKYLTDPTISLAAIGDVTSDRAPLQICDFSEIRNLDSWLEKLWLEGNGGGQHFESYEFIAYYYARLYDMESAKTPIFLFTGDEAFREHLSGVQLTKHFGGQHHDVDAKTIFRELKEKFHGNVFLIHRYYQKYALNSEIVDVWEKILGKECVIKLENDLAIADVTLGLIAIASGSRTLEQYIKDMKTRPLEMGGVKYAPQSLERIEEVRKCLEFFASTRKASGKTKGKTSGTKGGASTGATDSTGKKDWQV